MPNPEFDRHPHERGRSALFPWLLLGGALICAMSIQLLISAQRSTEEIPVLGKVPPFVLLDQEGQRFSSTSLVGHVWIASFIYTTCPGPCPRVVQRVAEIRRQFTADSRLKMVSFSVDPEADTPAVLAAYGSTHAIDPAQWKLLTGKVRNVFELIRDGFHLGVERVEEDKVDPVQGPITHSTRLALVDPGMQIRGYYDSDDPDAMRRLSADLSRLIKRVQP